MGTRVGTQSRPASTRGFPLPFGVRVKEEGAPLRLFPNVLAPEGCHTRVCETDRQTRRAPILDSLLIFFQSKEVGKEAAA